MAPNSGTSRVAQSLNPKPETLIPKPEALNPKAYLQSETQSPNGEGLKPQSPQPCSPAPTLPARQLQKRAQHRIQYFNY